MKVNHFIAILFCSFIYSAVTAQGGGTPPDVITEFNKITPPNPEAFAMQRAIKTPVDISTGVPNISIPIYSLKSGSVEIPITLNYHAGGVLVDQIATSVGLGWTLNAGGAVQRTIRGRPDHIPGSFSLSLNQAAVDNINNQMITPSGMDYVVSNAEDWTQDDYSFSFLGTGGPFYFDENQVPRQITKNTTFNINVIDEYAVTGKRPYFKIKDFDNNEYFFDEEESTVSITRMKDKQMPGNGLMEVGRVDGISAWKLSKIVDKKTNAISTFQYEPYYSDAYFLTADIFDKKKYVITWECGDPDNPTLCGENYGTYYNEIWNQNASYSQVINEIKTADMKVLFHYSINPNANYYAKQLDSIVVVSLIDSVTIKKVHFVYQLFGGNHQLQLSAIRQYSNDSHDFIETRFIYYENSLYPEPELGSRSKDFFGFYNGRQNTLLTTSTDNDYTIQQADRDVNPDAIIIGSLKRVVHNTGGFEEFIYEPNRVDNDTYGAGIRIKQQIEYDPTKDQLHFTDYEYEDYEGEKVDLPFNIIPEIHNKTVYRKIFNSNWKSYATLMTSVFSTVPGGHVYKKVTTKTKGKDYDLKQIDEFDVVPIFNGFRAIPKRTQYFTYNSSSSSYSPVKEEKSYYTISSEHPHILVDNPNPTLEICHPTYGACSMVSGGLVTSAVFKEYTISKIKDEQFNYTNGKTLTEKAEYEYNNPSNNFPTTVTKTTSAGTIKKKIKYPYEMVAGSLDPTGIYNTMQTKGLVAKPIVEETYDKSNVLLTKKINNYSNSFPNNSSDFFAVNSIAIGTRSNTPEIREEATDYDVNGNALEIVKDGFPSSYVWSYRANYPLAKVVNARKNEIAYCSFETISDKGNWYINHKSSDFNTSIAVTGKKSLNYLPGVTQIYKHGLPQKNYIVTYWATNSSMQVNGSNGTALTTRNGWTLYEHKLTNTVDVDLSSANNITIDELRLYPENSQMSTYTYQHGTGITSVCDDRHTAQQFSYDNFNRLITVKDATANILKKMEYSYSESGQSTIYYSGYRSYVFQKNDCGSTYSGGSYFYSVPERAYSSRISQADADAKAEKELNEIGQFLANKRTLCYAPCSTACLTAIGRRCVNGNCEVGQEKYTASVYNTTTGFYECTYHYEYTDGFCSIDYYTTTATSPCIP